MMGFRAGVRHTPETIEKMRVKATGRVHTTETKQKLSKFFSGRPIREEVRAKIQATMKAKFTSSVSQVINAAVYKMRRSKEYQAWRDAVLERDGFICIWCGESDKTKLTVDHIIPISRSFELALSVENGRILCAPCHMTASTHGRGSWSDEAKEKMLKIYA